MTDNIRLIKDTLSTAMSATTPQETQKALTVVTNRVANYVMRLDDFYVRMENESNDVIAQYRQLNADTNTISYALFKELQYKEDEIDSLLKEGYVLMDELRYFFTGERINYQIGIPYRGKLYEQSLTLEELLEYTHVSFNTKAKIDNLFKLRMTKKSDLRKAFQEKQKEMAINSKDNTTVYGAVWTYLTGQKAEGIKVNLGNAYEVYRVLLARRGSNEIPPELTNETIADVFTEIRSNTASSAKGGDYGTSQIKYFSNAPSLTTTSLLRSTLTEMVQILQTYLTTTNQPQFIDSLKQLFLKTTDSVADQLEKDMLETADKNLKDVIGQLGISVK